MNDRDLENELLQLKDHITMPGQVADKLRETCPESNREKLRRSHHPNRYRRLCAAAAAALLCLCAVGSTSFAYNTYQEKQLAVFMNPELTHTQIKALGGEISKITDVSACQYISGDKAWTEFKAAYFSDNPEAEALANSFTENPLVDSYNYRVRVRFSADTQAVREQIENLPGVRKITTVREAEQEMQDRD